MFQGIGDPPFIEQIRNGQPITVTNPEMTRFLMNLDEAVELVKFAFEHAEPGDLFIQKANASTIGTLAEAVQRLFGDTGIRIIGTRHGEKLYETLMTREERLERLKAHHNTCLVKLANSVQASLSGRVAGSEYGKSKLAGGELFFRYGEETGTKVLVYRFLNLFGKWCRPNYNSAVATFCNAVANDLEYTVDNRDTKLELLYIDDLVNELLDALEGKEHRCDYP